MTPFQTNGKPVLKAAENRHPDLTPGYHRNLFLRGFAAAGRENRGHIYQSDRCDAHNPFKESHR